MERGEGGGSGGSEEEGRNRGGEERGLTMRGNVDAISRILPDLVPHRAHRKSEHARGAGAIAVAARQRLKHELALDLLDCGADQQRYDLVR